MNKRKFLNICLVNELFDLDEETIIPLNKNLMLYKASDSHLHYIKPYLEIIGNALWSNYFENKIIPNNETLIPKLINLDEKKWRYTILHANHDMLKIEEFIALRLSDLRLKILVQRGFELNSKGEIPEDDNYNTYVSKNSFETFNILVQTSEHYRREGSEKFIRKIPTKSEIKSFQQYLNKIKKIINDEELIFIRKSLEDFFSLEIIPEESPFRIVSIFSIIELLITTNPKNSGDQSISKQLSNKIGLLYNNYFQNFHLENYLKGSDSNSIYTIIDKLYTYRSDIAHGNIPKFEKDLVIIQQNKENILSFLNELLNNILKIAIQKPNLVKDLKRC